MHRVRPPKAVRLRNLGDREPLQPDEVSVTLRVRLPRKSLAGVLSLTAKQRGDLLVAGLEEVQDATSD